MNDFFEIIGKDINTKARAGKIYTEHGFIETPIFMPVGTQGSVKAIEPRELVEINTQIILGNTYHLYLRPGIDVIEHFNGLHKFINWNKPLLTDSGGYQVFSLKDLKKITSEGIQFKSHLDGSTHFFSPEKVINIQRSIGSDIMMVLDECTDYPSTFEDTKKSIELSFDWAIKSLNHYNNTKPMYNHRQYLFAIAQGGMYKELRNDYLQRIIQYNFDGFSIGGLSVGEPNEIMYEITDLSTNLLPENKPRYLMGVGTPENILEAISLGIDMFDCVMPTRNARNGQIFTTRGKINIKNAKYKFKDEAIDEGINSYASNNFSLAYLRHLFMSEEILGLQLATMQNLAFYLWLVKTARNKILSGEFSIWKKEILTKLNINDK